MIQEEINFLKNNIKGLNELINSDLERYTNLHSLCEKQKLEFAIEQLKSLEPTDYDIEYSSADLRYFRNELRKRRVELEQKLSELVR